MTVLDPTTDPHVGDVWRLYHERPNRGVYGYGPGTSGVRNAPHAPQYWLQRHANPEARWADARFDSNLPDTCRFFGFPSLYTLFKWFSADGLHAMTKHDVTDWVQIPDHPRADRYGMVHVVLRKDVDTGYRLGRFRATDRVLAPDLAQCTFSLAGATLLAELRPADVAHEDPRPIDYFGDPFHGGY